MTGFAAYVPSDWTARGLEQAGYEGFCSFDELRARGATTEPGIYVVLGAPAVPLTLLERSGAGKHRDFTAASDLLRGAWIPGAETLYIGLARWGGRRDGIHRRLKQYRRTGAGTADNHGGGVWIFQLGSVHALTVCWRATADRSDEFVEALEHHLIADFVSRPGHGKWPFANRRD